MPDERNQRPLPAVMDVGTYRAVAKTFIVLRRAFSIGYTTIITRIARFE